jgi:hypothetical protein
MKNQIKKIILEVIPYVIFFIWFLFMTWIIKSSDENTSYTRKSSLSYLTKQDSIYIYMLHDSIDSKDIVYNQMRLETGNFTSEYYKKYHNMMGFGGIQPFKFKSDSECIYYIHKWQKMVPRAYNESYYDYLIRRRYAEDKEYINKLKQFN